jgi:hypothetical protein
VVFELPNPKVLGPTTPCLPGTIAQSITALQSVFSTGKTTVENSPSMGGETCMLTPRQVEDLERIAPQLLLDL